jgi:hypothetical protein
MILLLRINGIERPVDFGRCWTRGKRRYNEQAQCPANVTPLDKFLRFIF